MAGSEALAMHWAVFTTLCNAFQSKTEVPVPDCNTVVWDALDGAAVEADVFFFFKVFKTKRSW